MRRDIGEDTAGLEGPSESTSVLSDAYSYPPQYECRLSLLTLRLFLAPEQHTFLWILAYRPPFSRSNYGRRQEGMAC